MADRFENFNSLVRPVFNYRELRGQDLKARFVEVDRLLKRGIKLLLKTTTFVEDNLCFELAEIAIGSIKTRKLYRGRQVKDRKAVGQGVAIGAENARILGLGFDLFKLSRVSREVAPPLVQRVLRALRLSNERFEKILRAFVDITKDYQNVLTMLTVRQQALQDFEGSEEEVVKRLQEISSLIDEKVRVEQAVSCVDDKYLYGVVGVIKQIVTQIAKIQEEIVKAYLKLVPAIVRESAKSDKEALDMFQAGSIGLLHAASVYDHRSRAGFPNIARYWIRQRVQGALKQSAGTLIRLPQSVHEDYWEIRRAQRSLLQKNPQADTTNAVVAKKLNWSVAKVDQVLANISMAQVVSLDDDGDFDEEFIEREATVPDVIADEIEKWREQREYLLEMIECLDPEDRKLICLRYGLVDGIDNDQMDPFQGLQEIFRQLACKTVLNQWLAGRIDKVRSIPIEVNDSKEDKE